MNITKIKKTIQMKRLKTTYIGYPIEVILDPLPGCNVPDNTIPNSVMDLFCEQIEEGTLSGTFTDMPDDELKFKRGPGHNRSGSWRVIQLSYEKISRILSWEHNFSQDECLSEELFIRYYGQHLGRHYYNKWLFYDQKLHDMLAYFSPFSSEGQLFCDMVMEQVHKFEKRKCNETA